jgi:predicted small metal-binding protein
MRARLLRQAERPHGSRRDLACAAAVVGLVLTGCNWVTGADSLEVGSPKGSSRPPLEPSREPTGKDALIEPYAGTVALLAGTDGIVSALATYPGGSTHPGTNPVDIDADGGKPVWHQLGAIPADIGGGWLYVKQLHEAGTCSEWEGSAPHYNGDKAAVFTYFYGVEGEYLGWHGATYQHLLLFAGHVSTWWTWNSATASVPAWEDALLSFGDTTLGGLYLGDVFAGGGAVLEGPTGELCHDHDHLHQEGDGIRDPELAAQQEVSVRDSATHRIAPAIGYPMGRPPWEPPAADPVPEGSGSCGEIDYQGSCEAGLLTWCEAGRLQQFDCAAAGKGCGWQNNAVGYNCLSSCGDLDFAGGCLDESLRWCEDGGVHVFDCSSIDKGCAFRDEETGYDCQ